MRSIRKRIDIIIVLIVCCFSSCQPTSQVSQKTSNYADFDVMFAGSEEPAFRTLVPEFLWIDGQRHFCHTTPGRWHQVGNTIWGYYTISAGVEITVQLVIGRNEMDVTLEFKNTNKEDLHDVWMECCASLNHLRGRYGWCNRQFIPPDVPLIRSDQGDWWYEQLTPKHLFALTDEGWAAMHPHLDNPDHRQVPKYSFVTGPKPNARACAVQSPDEKAWFYQAWKSQGYYCTPCPGNACMHLRPRLADTLKPGQSVSVEGILGIFKGNRDDLTQKINVFCNENQ